MPSSFYNFEHPEKRNEELKKFDKLKDRLSKKYKISSAYQTRENETLVIESVDIIEESAKVKGLHADDILEHFALRLNKIIKRKILIIRGLRDAAKE